MKFKFHIVPQEHEQVRYQHESVALCEGLRELGHEFFGSHDYWIEPDTKMPLIKKAPNDFKSDVDVYSTFYFRAFPKEIDKVDHSKVNVFIDREDGLYGEYGNPKLKKFHLILRTHYNKNINYGYYNKNIKPWAFGLSNRIIKAVDHSIDSTIEDRTYVSFRLSHDLRSRAVKEMSPAITKAHPIFDSITVALENREPHKSEDEKLLFIQSGHRHDPAYYKLLNTSLLSFAFGGFIYTKPFATNRIVRQLQKLYKMRAALLEKKGKDSSSCYFINQFDSWRWWESLYSNTCPIHMDFENWQWVLPVMPENGKHYWGVKNFAFRESAEELSKLNVQEINKMGQAGRKWSVEHYAPKPTAVRFVEMVEQL